MTRVQRHAYHLVAFAVAIAVAGVIALVRAQSSGALTTGTSDAAQGTTGSPEAAPLASADELLPIERTFILESAANSRVQAEVSRLALSQATSSTVREFAQQMATDHAQFSTSLETLARRKALPLPVQPVSFPNAYRELAGRSGARFDRAFVQEASVASQRALRLCETAVGGARDADIRALAGALLPVFREHVNRTTELQKAL